MYRVKSNTISKTLCFVLIFSLNLSFAKDNSVYQDQLDKVVQEEIEKNHFQGSVLLAHKGIPFYVKNVGWANIENKIPVNENTKFKIGSISKQFLAAMILKLQEQEVLSVNDKISKFFPVPESLKDITIHHLLTHTSTIVDKGSAGWNYANGNFLNSSPERFAGWLSQIKVNGSLGTYSYSTIGYIILAAVLEISSKQPYKYLFQDYILNMANFKNTGLAFDITHSNDQAQGYNFNESFNPIGTFLQTGLGSEIYSSAADLLEWSNALFSNKIINESSVSSMVYPHCFIQTNDGFDFYYAYALFTQYQNTKLMSTYHSGFIKGYTSYLETNFDQELTIILLTNISNYDLQSFYINLMQTIHGATK